MNQIILVPVDRTSALVAAAGSNAQTRFAEFFVNTIRNAHTRRAYARNVGEFLAWCEDHGVAVPATTLNQELFVAKLTAVVAIPPPDRPAKINPRISDMYFCKIIW